MCCGTVCCMRRIYVAFDEGDHVYSLQSLRDAVDDYVSRSVAAENAKRWHPQGYKPGATVDNTTLFATVHWVSKIHASTPVKTGTTLCRSCMSKNCLGTGASAHDVLLGMPCSSAAQSQLCLVRLRGHLLTGSFG